MKRALTILLEGDVGIEEAYLAQVGYEPFEARSVALCIVGSQPESQGLLLGVQAVARRYLANDVHLDVIFLSEQQRVDLTGVCAPFYVRAI